MKPPARLTFVFTLLLLATQGTANAAAAEDPPAKQPTLRERILESFDADGDGSLSPSDRAAIRAEFARRRAAADNDRQPRRMTWNLDGQQREALVYPPATKSDQAAPVVFGFHGHGGSASNADRSFGFQNLWPEAVVVYMQGIPTPGRLTDPQGKRNGWQHDANEFDGRDLKFFDAVLATISKEYEVDRKRIYASGHSNGGGFTYLLWAHRPDVFAAIAPSAAASRSLLTARPQPIPVMHIAGENDRLVKFAWQQRAMQRVRQINRCAAEGKPWADDCTLYPSDDGAPLVAYIHAGTHQYPRSAPPLIVRFFQEH